MSKPIGPVDAQHEQWSGFDSLAVPVFRGSTIVYPDYASFAKRGERHRSSYNYGLYGTPTTRVLQRKLTDLEGAHDTFLAPSGLMAVAISLLAVCEAGDTILLPDNVYAPVRRLATATLRKCGIRTVYYDPRFPGKALDQVNRRLRLIWVEAPGSMTMEIPSFAEIRALAESHGALVGCDNSWATPLLCKPIDLGADIVVESLTKHLAGHSDVFMGSISLRNEQLAAAVYDCVRALGVGVSPDDCSLVLRGMESAAVRIAHMGGNASLLAEELGSFQVIEQVLHPGLRSSPYHDLWKSQFSGASGVFSVVLREEDAGRFASRFDGLRTFQIGASWGGAHSIMAPAVIDEERTIDRTYAGKKLVRLSVGLEALADLRADLARCFAPD
jgi:cysteine-S-conjugate beta-lyase